MTLGLRTGANEPQPGRVKLSAADLAACLAAVGATPHGGLFDGLPQPSTLRGELCDRSGSLIAPLAAAARVLAEPAQAHVVDLYRPSTGEVTSANLAASASGTAVLLNQTDSGFELALVNGRDEALVLLAALMNVPLMSAPPSRVATAVVSLPALAAIAALADLLREQTLRAELDRRQASVPAVATQPLDLNTLRDVVNRGLDWPDLRSGVSLLALLADSHLESCRRLETLEGGVRRLASAGFMDAESVPTPAGVGLALAVGSALTAARLLSVTGPGLQPTWSRIVTWRGPEDVLTARWQGSPEDPEIELAAGASALTLRAVWDLLASAKHVPDTAKRAEAASGTICPNCGTLCAHEDNFCRHCRISLTELTECPRCGRARRSGAAFCVSCRYEF